MSGWLPEFRRSHTVAVVVLLGLALAAAPFLPPLPLALQLSVLAAAVAVFGLPHGALDLALVRGAARDAPGALAAALGVYLAAAGSVVLLWLVAPVVALLGFLAVAVVHFGLGDTEDLDGPSRAVETLARGGFAGIAPLVFHPETTRGLFALLVGSSSAAPLDAALAALTAPLAWVWAAALAVALVGRIVRRGPGWLPAAAELVLTACVFAVFHPLAAFLLYFSFVHSVRHVADLGAARFPDSPSRAGRWLLRESLPFTAATLFVGAGAWLAFGRTTDFDEAMLRLIFWGLSALTVPHMILTAWWHRRGDPRPGDLFFRHV